MQYAVSSRRQKNAALHRRGSGSSFVELAIGMSALVPIAIALIDLCVMIVGVQTNDAVCRESARVAGKADPRDAQTLVGSIVDQANLRAPYRSTFKVLAVQSTIGERDIKALQPVGGPVSGTMTVETEVGIQTNMVHMFYGGKSPMIFHAKQTFPITYIVPPGTSYGHSFSFSSHYLSWK
ncbi:MAG: hypothetical protein P4L53_16160 [Candidatus Obscuribacterales bacterium]|nr:hypothetical protein [Candidatus Obscuribacterales bacterium]